LVVDRKRLSGHGGKAGASFCQGGVEASIKF